MRLKIFMVHLHRDLSSLWDTMGQKGTWQRHSIYSGIYSFHLFLYKHRWKKCAKIEYSEPMVVNSSNKIIWWYDDKVGIKDFNVFVFTLGTLWVSSSWKKFLNCSEFHCITQQADVRAYIPVVSMEMLDKFCVYGRLLLQLSEKFVVAIFFSWNWAFHPQIIHFFSLIFFPP